MFTVPDDHFSKKNMSTGYTFSQYSLTGSNHKVHISVSLTVFPARGDIVLIQSPSRNCLKRFSYVVGSFWWIVSEVYGFTYVWTNMFPLHTEIVYYFRINEFWFKVNLRIKVGLTYLESRAACECEASTPFKMVIHKQFYLSECGGGGGCRPWKPLHHLKEAPSLPSTSASVHSVLCAGCE